MSTSRRPLFSLAPSLAIHTPASPISISQAWQKSYPAPQCPFTSTSATSSSTLPPFLNLSQGVPGQLPSAAFRARLQEEASKDLHHSYSLAAPALRQNLAKQINEVYRRGQDPEGRGAVGEHDICVTAGCNSASEFVFRMLCQPGANEAVVIPTPFYFNHSMQLLSLSVEPLPLPSSPPAYLPSPSAFESLLKEHSTSQTLPKIKALVLVTPNNPTGSIYPPELIAEFGAICKREGIALVLDETYREFLISDEDEGGVKAPHGLFRDGLGDDKKWEWRQTVIHLYSFSKSFAIPGHRLGAIISHPSLFSPPPPSPTTPATFGPLAKALDNTLIVPPRVDTQNVVAWSMFDADEVRGRREVAQELRRRGDIFRRGMERVVAEEDFEKWNLGGSALAGKSLAELGWEIESLGGYYAFVRHPFNRDVPPGGELLSSSQVAEALASLFGVGILAADGFMPAQLSERKAAQSEESREVARDVCANLLRFSLANVADSRILEEDLPVRLAMMSRFVELRGKKAVFRSGS